MCLVWGKVICRAALSLQSSTKETAVRVPTSSLEIMRERGSPTPATLLADLLNQLWIRTLSRLEITKNEGFFGFFTEEQVA